MQVLRQWLRAHGFPVALYIGGDLASRKPVSRLQDRYELLHEVPSLFFPGEMRPVIQFLRAGNLLLMAVDRPDGHRSAVEAEDDWITHLNTGAARLANLTGADLMLASIVVEPGNRFRIRITPLAVGEKLSTEKEWAEVNRRLLAAQLPDFKAYPEQFFWHREPAPKKS
jgi:lauroyl/myristoyl acyltransferase